MRNTIITITLLMLVCLKASAQVTIIQYPAVGVQINASDVFKGAIQNASATTHEVIIEAVVTNTLTNQKILKAKTRPLFLAPGMLELNEPLLRPEYNYYSNAVQQTRVLPYGNYEMCLHVIFANEAEQALSSCQLAESSPLSPPLLVYPENTSVIYEKNPLLTWLPPMPIGNHVVFYELKLVEMMVNQTPYDAIQRNYPLVQVDRIKLPSLQYPANAMALTTEKVYAWKVIARMDDGTFIGETEIWTFTLKDPQEKEVAVQNPSLGLLRKDLDNGYMTVRDKKLYFQFDERYNQSKLTYRIYNDKNQETADKCHSDINKEVGMNRYLIDFSPCREMKKGMYLLKVANEKNEVFQMRFYISE